jgi:ATP phosphoribosyltransferase regulatory subunit HisZ
MAFRGQERYRSWIPHGFDYLDARETERRLAAASRVRGLFAAAGFREITPPSLDFAPTFSAIARAGHPLPGFELRGREGELLAVRSDLTVQVIKAAASGRLGREEPGRYSYIQPVFQDRAWGSGHSRETYQAGVELIGPASGRVGAMLALARECFAAADQKLSILYGDARFVEILLRELPEAARAEASLALYNKDTAELRRLLEAHAVAADLAVLLAETPLLFGDKAVLDKLLRLTAGRTELVAILEEARAVDDVIYDFSLVRELSYYSGPVFEGYLSGGHEKALTGGVYDGLYREFAGVDRPACGFALDLSLLARALAKTPA